MMMNENDALAGALGAAAGAENVTCGEPMERHTSFRTGGPADYFVKVPSEEALQRVLSVLQEEKEPYTVLGRGTNLLVGDGGYRGCVLTLTGGAVPVTDTGREEEVPGTSLLRSIRVEGTCLTAGAGASLAGIAQAAAANGLSGLSFAAGIPGSVGGGLVMNAGAYGGEMRQVVTGVSVLDETGRIREIPAGEMAFGYRMSALRCHPWIALSCTMKLAEGDPEKIRQEMADYAARRRAKQPLSYPSAGSTFKRPEGHYAGKLIQEAGLAGFSVGGACVSEKHCGFVINKDHATSRDIRDLIREIQRRVEENSGIRLEPEVIFLGEF